MPSRPILQPCARTVGPSPSMCSLNFRPGPALASMLASVALRTSSRSRRRSSPFSSIRHEATPLSSQATASPSMMQERERRRAKVSNNQREGAGKVIAGAAIEAHSRAVLPGDNPKTVISRRDGHYRAARRACIRSPHLDSSDPFRRGAPRFQVGGVGLGAVDRDPVLLVIGRFTLFLGRSSSVLSGCSERQILLSGSFNGTWVDGDGP